MEMSTNAMRYYERLEELYNELISAESENVDLIVKQSIEILELAHEIVANYFYKLPQEESSDERAFFLDVSSGVDSITCAINSFMRSNFHEKVMEIALSLKIFILLVRTDSFNPEDMDALPLD